MSASSKSLIVRTKSIRFRKQFDNASKYPNETASEWFYRVKKLAKPCIFGKYKNVFILNKFLIGLEDELLSRFASEHKSVHFDNFLEIIQAYEGLEWKNDSFSPWSQYNAEMDQTSNSKNSICDDMLIKSGNQNDFTHLACDKVAAENHTTPAHNGETKIEFIEPPAKPVHRRRKKESEQFACHLCDYKCRRESNLKRHQILHLNQKSFVCHVCGVGFKLGHYLINHLKSHSGESRIKQYPCDQCQKKFIQPHKLKIHQRTHSGERPYTCKICKKGFILNAYLNIHMRTHTGEKPYLCDICNKGFSQSSSLATHKKTH